MPGKVKVKVIAGRNLPIMDRSSDTTDAYVEVKFGNITHKTDVFRKSLNPQWNSDWFRFEVDDSELQDEPLQIRIMDYDTYSANDAIGKVYLDLNPLLLPSATASRGHGWSEGSLASSPGGAMLSGWLPVFDTMHGMRGEVSVIVKVELFSDVNKFRQSSCGVQFFCTPTVPCGFRLQHIHGFVKELVVNDDPEYQWIDKVRTSRASNEARQTLISQLSGEVRRRIGLKVIELGGNAVIGYQQTFDLEGETGIVVRGIGTAVTLTRSHVDATLTPLREAHGGRESRLHHSEPELCSSSYPLPKTKSPQSGISKSPQPKRKTSLSTFLQLPLFRRSKSRDHEAPKRSSLSIPMGGSLLTPPPVAGTFCTRSRSSPFNEMSPIEEAHHERIEAAESTVVNISQSVVEPTTVTQMGGSLYSEFQESDLVLSTCSFPICFISSSEDSLSSSSELEVVEYPLTQSVANEADCVEQQTELLVPQLVVEYHTNLTLNAIHSQVPSTCPDFRRSPRERPLPLEHKDSRQTLNNNLANSPAACTPGRPTPCRRRSSDSEISVTPKGASLPESVGSCGGGGGITPQANSRPPPRQSSAPVPPAGYASLSEASVMDMLEFPFFTMKKYPAGFIIHMGGTVSARSVKLLNQIKDSEEPETRDNWWTEIRMEIRSNARALGCNVILGYEEHTTICEEVCVLSVSGTAALVNLQLHEVENVPSGKEPDHKKDINKADLNNSKGSSAVEASDEVRGTLNSCRVCHIPYSKSSIPFPVKLSRCAICRKGRVPDILVATIDPPEGVSFTGRGCFLQARLCRARKDESRGDSQAKEISDSLPFLEYELHCQLIKKLRLKGMNAIFGLKVQVSIGEKHMVGVATGTAAYLTSLPRPVPPTVTSTNPSADEARLIKIRKLVMENFLKNQEIYGLKTSPKTEHDSEKNDRAAVGNNNSDSEESEDDVNELDLAAGNKDTFVLEIDDAKDADIVDLLIEPRTPEGVIVVTTESVPGLVTKLQRREIQAVTRVWRGRLPAVLSSRSFNECFEFILQSVYFKLRKMRPCVLTHVQFNVDLPEEDVIQITVLGNAVSQSAALPPTSSVPILPVKTGCESEMIFHLEEDTHGLSESASALCQSKLVSTSSVCGSRPLGERSKNSNQRDRHFVDITSLSRLPGARIERYLGHLNFFFIRESTSIREDGGLSGFMQSFITEVLAMVRAHVAALGGNAMVAYFMTECVLLHSPHKNQGQCLINVGGDVVSVTREKEA